jgi:hypothetical protein
VQPLLDAKIDSRKALLARWEADPKFLLTAVLLWLPRAQHAAATRIWPPVTRSTVDAAFPATAGSPVQHLARPAPQVLRALSAALTDATAQEAIARLSAVASDGPGGEEADD